MSFSLNSIVHYLTRIETVVLTPSRLRVVYSKVQKVAHNRRIQSDLVPVEYAIEAIKVRPSYMHLCDLC